MESQTAEFEADERSSITNRSTRGGVQSVATDQKGRGAVNKQNVVKHTHTTHPADAECAASATAETHQPSEFVTITIGFVTITIGHGEAEWRAMHRFMADQGNFVQRQIQAACRAALKAEK